MSPRAHLCAVALLVAAGCAANGSSPPAGAGGGATSGTRTALVSAASTAKKHKTIPITHVVVIIQENRSFTNLFESFPNAVTQSFGLNHLGQQVPLVSVPINQHFDPGHYHPTFVTEADYNQATSQYKMDGFDLIDGCSGVPSCPKSVYTYVQQSDIANYWTLASAYALGDETFQANMGPSFSAHQYLIAGQAGGYSSSHDTFYADPSGGSTTCFPPVHTSATLDMTKPYPGFAGTPQPTCQTYSTIFDELDTAGISWKYYARNPKGYWTAPNTIESLYTNDQSKISVPETNVLTDIKKHKLASVSYVTPADSFSDHPFNTLTNHGQDWIGLITNAIGADSYYWDNTVVIVTWDDWGGFYDSVPPPHAVDPFLTSGGLDPNEYGMRVPFIVIGAYVIPHTVDHTVRSFVSALTFIESVFNLPSLGTLDAQTDNLMTLFNFSQVPNTYQAVDTHGFTGAQALRAALHSGPIDDDMP